MNAEHDLSRSEATEANGVYFSGSAPTWANKDGAFTFTVTVPYGKVPKLYIQYSDALSDGFLPYEYELVREEGANNVYTFTVSPIPCDILWYIGLEADIFDITFVYGETPDDAAVALRRRPCQDRRDPQRIRGHQGRSARILPHFGLEFDGRRPGRYALGGEKRERCGRSPNLLPRRRSSRAYIIST